MLDAAMFRSAVLISLWVCASLQPAGPPEAQAKELFSRADGQYQTADYVGAAETFREAYVVSKHIADPELRENVQDAIIFNLARAHVKAYGTDPKTTYLRQALELLETKLKRTTDAASKAEEEALLAKARELLAEAEGESEEPAPASAPANSTSTPDPGANGAMNSDPGPAAGDADGPRRHNLEIAGYTSLGLSALSIGLLGAGVVTSSSATAAYQDSENGDDREDAAGRGNVGNALIVAGAATAGVLLASGIALVVVGKKKREQAALTMVPFGDRRTSGLGIVGSF